MEGYLFQQNSWQQFYANVAELPVDGKSVFVRPPLPAAGPLSLLDGHWNSDNIWISRPPAGNAVGGSTGTGAAGGSSGSVVGASAAVAEFGTIF